MTVRSAADAAILENPYGFAVSFCTGEGPDSVLRNLVIRNSFTGVLIAGSSPTISNVTVVGNTSGVAAYAGSEPGISNSIFWNNAHSDLAGCEARYSFVRQAEQPPEGLISYWKFDEGGGTAAHDSAGDNDGTVYGAHWSTGRINGALSLDGEDDYVALPDNSPVWLPQYDFSISAWIYIERGSVSLASESEVILDLNYGASADPENELGYNIQRRGESKRLSFHITTTTNSDEDLYSNEVLVTNRWHHIVALREGGIQAIYINGLLDASRTCSADPIDFVGGYDDDRINIGRFTTNIGHPRYHFKGKIDDVMIFGRALATEEIRQLHQSRLNGHGFVTNPLFVDPANDDYHLLSERGRYWPEYDLWVLDKVTSPCIDGGDPHANYSNEPVPDGGRINMGAYGGTRYASMSEMQWLDADVNRDGVVDISDIVELMEWWLEAAGWIE
ncbi:MAG: LamG domain-containing protein [Planctomycetota bacterium]